MALRREPSLSLSCHFHNHLHYWQGQGSAGRALFAWLAPWELDLQAWVLHGGRFLPIISLLQPCRTLLITLLGALNPHCKGFSSVTSRCPAGAAEETLHYSKEAVSAAAPTAKLLRTETYYCAHCSHLPSEGRALHILGARKGIPVRLSNLFNFTQVLPMAPVQGSRP